MKKSKPRNSDCAVFTTAGVAFVTLTGNVLHKLSCTKQVIQLIPGVYCSYVNLIILFRNVGDLRNYKVLYGKKYRP